MFGIYPLGGIYPETKHPTYHQSIGLPLEPKLVKVLKNAGWDRKDSPVFIQSFEQANLKALRKLTKVRLIQLVDANDVNPDGSLDFTAPFDRPSDWTVSSDPTLRSRLFSFFVTDAGLKEIKTYADGIGPSLAGASLRGQINRLLRRYPPLSTEIPTGLESHPGRFTQGIKEGLTGYGVGAYTPVRVRRLSH